MSTTSLSGHWRSGRFSESQCYITFLLLMSPAIYAIIKTENEIRAVYHLLLFVAGFVYYCFMHVFLHTPFAKKVFPNLQSSHIHHHCKCPDRCFGTCHRGGNKLFNTSVPKTVKISDGIIDFYFGKSGH